MIDLQYKIKIHETCLGQIEGKITELTNGLDALQRDADEETKSSAGDKYETGRAMLMLEKEKLASQLIEMEKMHRNLSSINPKKEMSEAGRGSLVKTDSGIFYLAVGFGKITYEHDTLFVISMASPMGKLLSGKRAGDILTFNGRTTQIQAIT